jgi:hypothetical protein
MRWPWQRVVSIKKGKLEDVDVERVSLLFDGWVPKNGKGVIFKGSNRKVKHVVKGSEGYVYLTVMEPNVKDSDGDSYTAAEIQKACDKFAKKGMTGKINVNHSDTMLDDFYITQSYILKAEDKENFPDTAVDSWVWIAKCEDLKNPYWEKIVKGLCNGASLEAKAIDTGDTDELIKGLQVTMTKLTEIMKGNVDAAEAKRLMEEAQSTLDELKKQDADGGASELIKGLSTELTKAMKELTKAVSTTLKGAGGDDVVEDKKVIIKGVEIIIKGDRHDYYKGLADAVKSGSTLNILTANTSSMFVDAVIESQSNDTFSDITVTPLMKDEKIDKGLVQDVIFHNSKDDDRESQSIVPADIDCPTEILFADFDLGKDTVEFYIDKYGEVAFGAYVEHHLVKKCEKALRKLLFKGDRTSEVAALKAINGVLTKATTDTDIVTIDSVAYGTWIDRFMQVQLGFDEDTLEEQEDFKVYLSQKDLIRAKAEVSDRRTNKGDQMLIEGGNLSYSGMPVKPRFIPDDTIIAGLMKFIFCGVRTDVEMFVRFEKDWKWHWYVRLRAGFTYLPNFVKFFKLEEPAQG